MEFLLLFYYLCICQKKKSMETATQQSPLMPSSSQGFACVPEGVLVSLGVCELVSHSHADTRAL